MKGSRALLTAVLVLGLGGEALAQDFGLDPEITQEQFEELSMTVSRAIYASPVEPAGGGSILGFDLGVAVAAIEVDEETAGWVDAVDEDILQGGRLLVPRIVASKGLGRLSLSASYMQIPDTDVEVWGAALDVPLIRGGLTSPTIAARGTWAQTRGIEELELEVVGIEGFISKGFGPITPYAGIGIARTDATGVIEASDLNPAIMLVMEDEEERLTLGASLSLLLFKVVVEAVETGPERVYAAKFSFSL